MPANILYENSQDAHRYLSGTVCAWEGVPVYVHEVNRNFEAFVSPLPLGSAIERYVDTRSPNFNCTRFRTGFVNDRNGRTCSYLYRAPSRTTAQGLSAQNSRVKIPGNPERFGIARDMFHEFVRSPTFADALMGTYPSKADVIREMMADRRIISRAFSRDFCIRRHPDFSNLFYLNYRGDDVAWGEGARFALPKEYTYLNEVCDKQGAL